jgi:hypothetical protein
MLPGQAITTEDGQYQAKYTEEGDLAVFSGSRIMWSTNVKQKTKPGKCVLHGDGNLVLYNSAGQPYWYNHGALIRNASLSPPCSLFITDAGRLRVTDSANKVSWRNT